MTPTPPPPGWYTDPWDPAWQRYWDGASWTAARSPLPTAGQSAGKTESRSKKLREWFSVATDWLETGTALVRLLKTLLVLIGVLGPITLGGIGVKSILNNSGSVAALSSSLLQPSDLGSSGLGWSQTQANSSVTPCPSLPRQTRNRVSTALSDGATDVTLYEVVWKLGNPQQVISSFANSAHSCSFRQNDPVSGSPEEVTYQSDDSLSATFGDASRVFSVGLTGLTFSDEPTTIGAYQAVIAHGDLLASVYVTTGTAGTMDSSTLSSILAASAQRLS